MDSQEFVYFIPLTQGASWFSYYFPSKFGFFFSPLISKGEEKGEEGMVEFENKKTRKRLRGDMKLHGLEKKMVLIIQ